MDYKETLLNSDDFERLKKSKNVEKIDHVKIQEIIHKTDAFHDANIFSKLFFCWINKIFGVKYIFIEFY